MIVDLHTHTRYGSNCSRTDPVELVRRAKEVGLDGLCITEHELSWEPEALAALEREFNILMLGGVEVATDVGEVLVYGVRDDIWKVSNAEELRGIVDQAGGVMIAAHPFRRFAPYNTPADEVCCRPVFKLVDAIEVFNANCSANRQEVDYCIEMYHSLNHGLKLKGIGGSDSHQAFTVGQCVTVFDREIANEDDLVRELKAGRFKAVNNILGMTC